MKAAVLQSSFNAGELSPLLFGRVDVAKYKNGLATMLNLIPLIQGGLVRRPGTYYVAPTKANGVARLLDFEFSTTQAYIIEAGASYMRFYMNHGAITDLSLTITNITQASVAVVSYTGTDPTSGDDVEISGVVGMTQVNGRRFTITNVNTVANTFELTGVGGGNIDSTGFTAYASGGTAARVYEIATPYAAADLFKLRVAQSADTMYICCKGYAPRKLTRSGHASWTLSVVAFLDGPYLPVNTSATTITPNATSGQISLTATGAIFTAGEEGRLVRIKNGANWGYCNLTNIVNNAYATANVISNFAGNNATTSWRFGVWSNVTNYPAAVCFSEDRLCFGGSTNYPQRVDASNSGDYENFAPTAADGTVTDSNAIAVTLNANDVNAIRWLQEDEKGLLIGTVGGEWILAPASSANPLSPTNVKATRSTTFGSADLSPIKAGKGTLYMQRAGRKLRELAYLFQVDGFRAPDMTTLSEHITLGGIVDMAYQQETQSLIWMPRADGILVGFTYERDQEVLAWHRHQIGGWYDADQMQKAKCESVAAIPAPDGTRDEVWMVTNRYIAGATRRYVEYMTKPWEHGDRQAESVHMDSAITLRNNIAAVLVPGTGANVADSTNVPFNTGSAIFTANDVHRYIHYDYNAANGAYQRGSAIITNFTSNTAVRCNILYPWPNLTNVASGGWRMTVTQVNGAWHMQGDQVRVFADGATQPNQTVNSTTSTVNLSYPASIVTLGYGYQSDGQRMRDEAGSADGSAQTKIRRNHRVGFRFLDTLGVQIGPTFNNMTQKVFRTSADPASVAPPLFTGDKIYEWEGDYDTEGNICFRQDQPEPMTLLAIAPRVFTQDGS